MDDNPVFADGEQTFADTDQTLSDVDQTSADRNQAASDRDLEVGSDAEVHDLSLDPPRRSSVPSG